MSRRSPVVQTRRIVGPLVLALLVVATPVAADHTPDRVRVADHTIEDPVDPLGDPAQVVLDVRVPCQDDETATAWTRAELVDAPGFLVFETTGVTNDTSTTCHDADDVLTVGLPVEIGFTQDAPAFEPVTATVEVHVQKNHTGGNVTHLDPAEAEITATPGYLNLYNARVDKKIAQAGPQESVEYPIVIDNYSNGPTRFEFSLSHPDSVPDGFQAVVPEPLVLQSNATGGETTTGTVAFTVYTPFHNGYVNEVGAVQLQIDSFYAENESYRGESSHISTLTQARGLHVPGPGALMALVALGSAALAVGWRRI